MIDTRVPKGKGAKGTADEEIVRPLGAAYIITGRRVSKKPRLDEYDSMGTVFPYTRRTRREAD